MANDVSKDIPDEVQRWTAKRRVALVLTILKGETTVVEAARKHGLTVADVEEWREPAVDQRRDCDSAAFADFER